MEKKKDQALELANERIERAKKSLAKCLSMLETSSQEVKWACESQNWNEDVAYLMDEAATKLGFALATLVQWDDEPEEED